jgi:hypothetical protein
MGIANATTRRKSVADPCSAYESMRDLWYRSRAICGGERLVKAFDTVLDTLTYTNLLIPFSPTMTPAQYSFYKAEAELPGVVSQYAKMVIGGLLRKAPQLELPDTLPLDAKDWILNNFGQDGCSLSSFLDAALWEELQTSRAWVFVDYPAIDNYDKLTRKEQLEYKPYPVLWTAESVINWSVHTDSKTGASVLNRVIVRQYEEQEDDENEFHPKLMDIVRVHELDENGYYQVRVYSAEAMKSTVEIQGKTNQKYTVQNQSFELVDTLTDIMCAGERLNFIPAWPLNGSIELVDPMLDSLCNKEISLYNKISRRNHLLYGAATYTPVISSNMLDEDFGDIVAAGLGSWIKLQQGDTATILDTPTTALADMDRSIAAGFDEMARLGVRMLTPEVGQSGIALDIRNAAQTAQLGTLNNKVSQIMSSVIAFMLQWRYGEPVRISDIKFTMSADFNPAPLGDAWLRLITEWYQNGLLPRDTWLTILKLNDIIPPDYDDEEATQKINADELLLKKTTPPNLNQTDMANSISNQN